MNIYKIERTDRIGWDEYDSIVIYAEDEKSARNYEFDWNALVDNKTLEIEFVGSNNDVVETSCIHVSFCAG